MVSLPAHQLFRPAPEAITNLTPKSHNENCWLVFGGVVVDKRSAFVLEGGEDDVFHRLAPEAGAFMQVSDELTPKAPKVVTMFAQCFAG